MKSYYLRREGRKKGINMQRYSVMDKPVERLSFQIKMENEIQGGAQKGFKDLEKMKERLQIGPIAHLSIERVIL